MLGGEFTQVNGQRQAGLVRFQGSPESPDSGLAPPATAPTPTPSTGSTTTPTSPVTSVPNRVSKPGVAVLGPTAIAVKWSAPKAAAADNVTGYVVKAYKGSKVVKTVAVNATKRLATISGLKRSTTYRIGVAAKNAQGTGKISSFVSAKTKARGRNVSATKHPGKVNRPSTAVAMTRVRARRSTASSSGAVGVSGYQIRLMLHGKVVKTVTVSSRTRTTVVAGLHRRTTYQVSVRAENWAGWGSWSSARSARTR